MSHPNAVLTPRGRRRLVSLVEEQGLTFRAAAAALNVSVATVWEWVTRWRRASAGERQGLACLHDRSSAPHRQPRLIAGELEMAHQSVWKVLRRHGFSRVARTPREAARRYEWPCPGDLLHMDTKRYARFTRPGHAVTGVRDRTGVDRHVRVGYQYAHAIIDDLLAPGLCRATSRRARRHRDGVYLARDRVVCNPRNPRAAAHDR